jgi:hypothetical protein
VLLVTSRPVTRCSCGSPDATVGPVEHCAMSAAYRLSAVLPANPLPRRAQSAPPTCTAQYWLRLGLFRPLHVEHFDSEQYSRDSTPAATRKFRKRVRVQRQIARNVNRPEWDSLVPMPGSLHQPEQLLHSTTSQ